MGSFRSGFVAIVGRPNVGKSTLLNSMIGRKVAIVSDKPQTTRNRISGVLTGEGYQIVFVDTPGIHRPQHKLGEYMVRAARAALTDVDLILFTVDGRFPPGGGDRYLARILADVSTPVFLLVNKMDAVRDAGARLEEYSALGEFAEVMGISALTGEGVRELVEKIRERLPEGPMYYPEDEVTDQPEVFIAAELIREKVLHLTREEVPHAVAVEVTAMEERDDGLLYIGANIYVERDSQKGIIIGKGGSMLREIGRLARQEMEGLFATRIFLELWVKVKKDWRNREGNLHAFGYGRE